MIPNNKGKEFTIFGLFAEKKSSHKPCQIGKIQEELKKQREWPNNSTRLL